MAKFKDKEPGPLCFCGNPTLVSNICEDEAPILLCFFHTKTEALIFELPFERPLNWPNLTPEEMDKYFNKNTGYLTPKSYI